MKTRRWILALAAAFALLGILLLVWPVLHGTSAPAVPATPVSAENAANTAALLTDLVNAYTDPADTDQQKIAADLESVRAVSEQDYALLQSIAAHWQETYLNPDYTLYLYDGGEKAEALADAGIPEDGTHAIVVLGYELQDGEMQPELLERCDAAAALARQFPQAILVVSGGATGGNNPEQHTEAGLMKEYLSEVCGIDEARIHMDERAMTTQENARNTMDILAANGIRTMTIVTSRYHQLWGQAVYHAMAEVCRLQRGYSVDIVGNYSCDVEPSVAMYRNDAQIAVRQIGGILGLSADVLNGLPMPPVKDAEEEVPAGEQEQGPIPEPAVEAEPEQTEAAADASPAAETEAEPAGITALDYADPENWAFFAVGEDRDVDVFMIAATVDTRSATNALDLNDKLKARFLSALERELSIYGETGRVFSPYYRQMSINAYMLPEDERQEPKQIAYADVAEAFRWYLEHENNGRGIILAGFSQGGEMCLELMKEFYGGEGADAQALRDRLVATYAIGWAVTEELTEAYPQIVPASGETDTGTVISFDCEDGSLNETLIIPLGVKALSINPLNWVTDGTPADRSLNRGALVGSLTGSDQDTVPELCGAYIGDRGELVVTGVSADDYPSVLSVFPEGAFHLYDEMFFYTNLKDNVADRTAAWLAAQSAAEEAQPAGEDAFLPEDSSVPDGGDVSQSAEDESTLPMAA